MILDFGHQNDKTFANFVAGQNQELLSRLKQPERLDNTVLFISGPNGCGKTHLLSATCTEANFAAAYISLRDAAQYSTEILLGLESLPLICVDDIHLISGNREWEEALFNLL